MLRGADVFAQVGQQQPTAAEAIADANPQLDGVLGRRASLLRGIGAGLVRATSQTWPHLDQQDWKSNPALARTEAEVTAELGDRGRVLIRKSGTEPLLRVMVEASDAALAQRCAERLAEAIRG